jgi:hypothetical protein
MLHIQCTCMYVSTTVPINLFSRLLIMVDLYSQLCRVCVCALDVSRLRAHLSVELYRYLVYSYLIRHTRLFPYVLCGMWWNVPVMRLKSLNQWGGAFFMRCPGNSLCKYTFSPTDRALWVQCLRDRDVFVCGCGQCMSVYVWVHVC